MIDIHTHILPLIDDGCQSFDDSLATLKEAEKKGIKAIILTPHYIKGSKFSCNNQEKDNIFKKLQQRVIENNIKIDLYLGNEIYFDSELYDFLNNKEAMTLNNSRYMLFELPMTNKVNNLKEVIFNLRGQGIVPIIAHPERYTYFQDEPEALIPLIQQGCLFQGNLGSLVGIYGKRSKKCLKILLTNNLIHFMASDVHRANSKNYIFLNKGIIKLQDLVGKEITKLLIEENPKKIINNQEIFIKEPQKIKKRFCLFN